MVNSFIAKKDLDSEMTVVRNEFESGENYPQSVLMNRVLSTAFLWHNYGHTTIGSRADLENVPINRLQAFYRTYYQPDNAVLLVAGRFDTAKTLALIVVTRDVGFEAQRDAEFRAAVLEYVEQLLAGDAGEAVAARRDDAAADVDVDVVPVREARRDPVEGRPVGGTEVLEYDLIQWETGGASGGDAQGCGGSSARVGWSNGGATSFELAGSAVNGAFMDSGTCVGAPGPNALIFGSLNSSVDGRYMFSVREGEVLSEVPEPSTLLLLGAGLATLGARLRSRRKAPR